jgi:hypothetical protein
MAIVVPGAVGQSDGEVADSFKCTNPACFQEWSKIALKRSGLVPVVSNYSYIGLQQTKHGVKPANRRIERPVSEVERLRVKEIGASSCPYWVPNQPMDKMGPQYRRNALSARNIQDVRDFYSPRNMWALSLLWNQASKCRSPRLESQVRFCITSISLATTRMYAYRSNKKGGILKGSLYFPSLTQEMNVFTAFSAKIPDSMAVAERRSQFAADAVIQRGSASSIDLLEPVQKLR